MTGKTAEKIVTIYKRLYDLYGPQGWWPLMSHDGTNPTKTGSVRGYHPENYELPRSEDEIYEIILGAILTQNTAWTSAEQALIKLKKLDVVSPQKLLKIDDDILKEAIRCAGFLNQKAVYLKEITKFFISLKGRTPERKELLTVKGVGNETADSILLYAFKQPEFVVDAYTKRIFSHLGIVKDNANYMDIKKLFESSLPRDTAMYQEYHALIVEHAKHYYKKKPYGVGDPLKDL